MKAGPLDGGGSWAGMKHKSTGKCYGVVRQIGRANELISESTFLNNRLHGLVLQFTKDKLKVLFYKSGQRLAALHISRDCQETSRQDPQNFFAELTAESFSLQIPDYRAGVGSERA